MQNGGSAWVRSSVVLSQGGQRGGIVLQFGGRDRTVIAASNAMEYAFEEGELADTEVAPRCSPPLPWKGWRPGRPTATRTPGGLDELYEYARGQGGGSQ